MTGFSDNIRFKYRWRNYQQRVLNELEEYMADRHLHIIAPPGSGKTVLGLEVARRLGKPVLILAPTIAIRNQWIERFCALFVQSSSVPDWISTDIRQPAFMTVVTYQGLYAACNNRDQSEEEEPEEEETEIVEKVEKERSRNTNLDVIVKGLQARYVETIVADEAHHLKNEWWQTLIRVKEKMNPAIIALTATPPYDVSAAEWQRYSELNGPVDTEIAVPELVAEGDLCPHQDYIWFSSPTDGENQRIVDFRERSEKLFREIAKDAKLAEAIRRHPVWQHPDNHLDWIYSNLKYYSACLIFLHSGGEKIPRQHLAVIDENNVQIPAFDYFWAEVLLDFYLYREKQYFKAFEEHKLQLENRLKRSGVLERRQLSFGHNRRISGLLTSSIGKLESIAEIVALEHKALGKQLRMLILADYVRKEYFTENTENNASLEKLGVVPVFEKLRREYGSGIKLAILSGSLIIIPRSAHSLLAATYKQEKKTSFTIKEVAYDPDYVQIITSGKIGHDMVHYVTQVFQSGEIDVLIGTRSLLGEGWDAPAVNSLILASFVGSFVLSNQMRGRAIRSQNGNPEKTANIWHLVCIDPSDSNGGDDLALLRRRFRSFVGISNGKHTGIENGIGRLNLSENLRDRKVQEKQNGDTRVLASDRHRLKQQWQDALASGQKLVEEIRIPFPATKSYRKEKKLYLLKTLANLLATLSSALMAFSAEQLDILSRMLRKGYSPEELYRGMMIMGCAGILIFGRLSWRALRLYVGYRDIAKDLHQMGEALLHSLVKEGIIRTELSGLKVEASVDYWGGVLCHLEGGTTFEKSLFINALQEMVNPIDNPRYVIIRRSTLLRVFDQRDYHSVPELLGRNKNQAEYFSEQWRAFVGSCDLVFTRTKEGRQLLLQARIRSLASQLEDNAEHVSIWK